MMQKVIIRGRQIAYIDLTPEEETERLEETEHNTPTPEEIAREEAISEAPIGARAWFNANPNAKLIFSMTVQEVATEIAALIDVSFPALSAANRTRWKLLLTAIVLVVRIFVKRERLD